MKLIIWWCALMIILPFLYLSWWKKRWRLLSGIVILVVLVIGYLVPGELSYSILITETEREKPLKQLENNLRNILNGNSVSSIPEKLELEKAIIKIRKEIKQGEEKFVKGEGDKKKILENIIKHSGHESILITDWVEKWGKKENTPTLLFCGEEFNKQLMREGKSGNRAWKAVKDYNIIDFGQAENNKLESFQKKIKEIYKQEKNYQEGKIGKSPIIWFKNIDKITNSELEKELAKVVDPNQNTNLGKCQVERYFSFLERNKEVEETINLSNFTLVATTSTTSPQLTKELRDKLKHVEPFLDKYFWVIFLISGGLEIIAFLLLIKSRKKSKNKSLRHLEY